MRRALVLMVRHEPVPVATGSNDTIAMSARKTLQSWSSSSGIAAPSELARWSMSLDVVEILESLVLLVLARVEHVRGDDRGRAV